MPVEHVLGVPYEDQCHSAKGKKPVLIIDVSIYGRRHVYSEGIASLEHDFKKLANEIAKEVFKAFKK